MRFRHGEGPSKLCRKSRGHAGPGARQLPLQEVSPASGEPKKDMPWFPLS